SEVVTRMLALPVDDATRRNLLVRSVALGDAPEAPLLRAYLWSRTELDPVVQVDRARKIAAGTPLGHYLVGRVLFARAAWGGAGGCAAGSAGGLTEPLVARENDRMLAIAAYLADRPSDVAAAARRLAADPDPVVALLGEDWLERLRFDAAGRL